MPPYPGRLHCVSAWSPRRPLTPVIEAALLAHLPADDVRHLFESIYLIYADTEPATVRDWLAAHLEDGELAFVVEFERWSAFGLAPDRDWLLARGH